MIQGKHAPLPHVSIVVLNWNDSGVTIACLDALRATTYPNYSIIVVENGSTDGSADRLRKVENIDLITSPENLGYTGGVNLGIARALAGRAEYVWLLNSDAKVKPDVLSLLVAAAQSDNRVGLVSPVIFANSLRVTLLRVRIS